MSTKLGYKWNSLAAARNAQQAARVHFGIPVSPDATTKEWFVVDHDIDNGFYFFEGDLAPIFGSATEFEVSDNVDFNV